jgi:hypothetical protein
MLSSSARHRVAPRLYSGAPDWAGVLVPTLIADGVLDRGKAAKQDAWGQPWTIECDDRDATITSRGPDQRLGTEDDIRVPPT